MPRVVVIGASRGPGRLLFERLCGAREVVGIARNPAPDGILSMDAADTEAMARLIRPDDIVVHCSQPALLTGLLDAGIRFSRLIAVGSTRVYTRYPDKKCRDLKLMEEAVWRSPIKSTVIHATMIYGAPGLNNLERIKKVARISPLIPLPDSGRALVQPVHGADVAQAIILCLDGDFAGETFVIAGESPLAYRDFVGMAASSAGHRVRIVSLPVPLLKALAALTRCLPFLPDITADEIQRLTEDKSFSNEKLIAAMGFTPRSFETGLRCG